RQRQQGAGHVVLRLLDLRLDVLLVVGVFPVGVERVEHDGDFHRLAPPPPRTRNAERGTRNSKTVRGARMRSPLCSALRVPRSAFTSAPAPCLSPRSSAQ